MRKGSKRLTIQQIEWLLRTETSCEAAARTLGVTSATIYNVRRLNTAKAREVATRLGITSPPRFSAVQRGRPRSEERAKPIPSSLWRRVYRFFFGEAGGTDDQIRKALSGEAQ